MTLDINIDELNQRFKQCCDDLLRYNKSNYQCVPNSIKHFCNSNKKLNDYILSYDETFTVPRFMRMDTRDEYYRKRCDMIKLPKKYNNVWEQYKFIESQPQPEQRKPLWYEMRNSFITASSGAQAIGESKYEAPIEMVKSKVGLGKPFKENYHVHHGKKLETIATLIYEYIFNVKVGEFGLVAHISTPHISFLGASPDGICSCSTLDGQFSPLVGRMLEIKCVTTRKINVSGPEDVWPLELACPTKPGGYPRYKDFAIVPHIYWIQVQLQLECCNLEDCDFWQCKLRDYWSERLLRENMAKKKPVHTIGQGTVIDIDSRLEYGTLIELLPKNRELLSHEKLEWFSAYIYPDKLDLTLKEKINWANDMKANWKKHYPEYVEEYKFGKILYYHLEQSHCYLVKRDRKWFKKALPRFAEFWDQVLMYRNDENKRNELIEQIAMEEEAIRLEIERKQKEQRAETAMCMDSDED